MKRFGKIWLGVLVLLGSMTFVADKTAHAADYVVEPQIASGYYHGLALHTNGTVYGWGQNTMGQLGNGSTVGRKAPIIVQNLTRVKAVAAGIRSSYAIKDDGTLWAWGMNENGQLGDGTTENRSLPVQITGIHGDIKALSTGVSYHTLALTEDGKVWAWGKNDSGELGDGTTIQRNAPVEIPGLNDVIAIAAGGWHSLALKSDGTVWTWGNNEFGELGDGTTTNSLVPKQVDIQDVKAIGAGNSHSLAVKHDGSVWSWGMNTWGMLGDGTGYNRNRPVQVLMPAEAKAVVGGGHHSYALTEEGKVWAWGFNGQGEMGDGTWEWRYTPIEVGGLTDVRQIAAGGFSGYAMQSDGTVLGWGMNTSGELGDNTTENRRVPVINAAVVDLTPPTVGDPEIVATDIGLTEATLNWTKAEDNLTPPSELEYRVYRVGSNNAGTVSAVESGGVPLGSYEKDISTKTVTGLFSGQTYHFSVIVKDKAGRKNVYGKKMVRTPDNPTYTVIYEGNGSTGGEPPLDPFEYWEGELVEVLGNIGGLTRTGYSFAGWSTRRDGLGTVYVPGDAFPMPAADVTLHARWSALPDTEGPSAIHFSPERNARNVSVSNPLSVSFNELVSAVDGKTVVIGKTDGGWSETISVTDTAKVTVAGARVTIRPSEPLDPSSEYAVRIDPGAFVDGAGNPFAGIEEDTGWRFETEAEPTDPPGDDATLAALSLAGANGADIRLSPAFDREKTAYAATVPYSVMSLSVTAATYDAGATMVLRVYDDSNAPTTEPFALTSGESSPALPLQQGVNRIELLVTAENATTRTYDIHVFREGSSSGGSGGGGSGGGSGGGGGGGGGNPATTPEPPASDPDLKLTIGDRSVSDGLIVKRSFDQSRTKLTARFDPENGLARLDHESERPRVVISTDKRDADVELELTGAIVQSLAVKGAILELRTPYGGYKLPAAEIRYDDESSAIIAVSISQTDAPGHASVPVVGKPVAFAIIVSEGGRTKEMDNFGTFVERLLDIPDGMNPDRITTVAVLEEGGYARHVPTRIESRGGRYVAVARSLTNSVYALVAHPVAFADMDRHWARNEVNDLASRLIVNGTEADRFHPASPITRAEFAAMIVRALGLSDRGTGNDAFADVASNAWYAGAASAAKGIGIAEGDEQGNFHPSATITREEAAAMIARAMIVTGLSQADDNSESVVSVLERYRDADAIAGWAKAAVAENVRHGLLQGDRSAALLPKTPITRAEAAVVVSRLLQRSGFID
ncbi:S-layer homology domain-containing protein [Paenibacillaceae bacterium WGS1546]|uniref:RCC1 domain-containing protein n=1 Tax=Cohnella sp. WGS1546 TaxID=3366810 RepID=UPI00372D7519